MEATINRHSEKTRGDSSARNNHLKWCGINVLFHSGPGLEPWKLEVGYLNEKKWMDHSLNIFPHTPICKKIMFLSWKQNISGMSPDDSQLKSGSQQVSPKRTAHWRIDIDRNYGAEMVEAENNSLFCTVLSPPKAVLLYDTPLCQMFSKSSGYQNICPYASNVIWDLTGGEHCKERTVNKLRKKCR